MWFHFAKIFHLYKFPISYSEHQSPLSRDSSRSSKEQILLWLLPCFFPFSFMLYLMLLSLVPDDWPLWQINLLCFYCFALGCRLVIQDPESHLVMLFLKLLSDVSQGSMDFQGYFHRMVLETLSSLKYNLCGTWYMRPSFLTNI